MSEEHLQESTDETLVLKNQFGCMTAIFQMFETRRVLPGNRVRCHGHKRLPQGNTLIIDFGLKFQFITVFPVILLSPSLGPRNTLSL